MGSKKVNIPFGDKGYYHDKSQQKPSSPSYENVLSKFIETCKQSQPSSSKDFANEQKQITQFIKTVEYEGYEISKQCQTAASGTSRKNLIKAKKITMSGSNKSADVRKQSEEQSPITLDETKKLTPQSLTSISSISSVIIEYNTAPSSKVFNKEQELTIKSTENISYKSLAVSEQSMTSPKSSAKQQETTSYLTTEENKSIVGYKENPQKLSTIEIPEHKFYRLRDQNKYKLTVGKDLTILTNVYEFKFSDILYVDLYNIHFLNSEKKIHEKFKQSRKRDIVMNVLYRELKNKMDLNNFIYDDNNLLYVKSGVLEKEKYEYCVDPEAKKLIYIRFEKTKHFPIILSNTDDNTSRDSNTFLSLMITQFSKFSFSQNYNESYIGIGNELYFIPPMTEADNYSLDFMRQIWSNLCFNILLGQRGVPLINVHKSHAIFAKSELTIIDIYCFMNGTKRRNIDMNSVTMNNNQRQKLTNLLKNLNLTVEYDKSREYTIFNVVDKIPEEIFFDRDGINISILEYFNQRHSIRLKYPNLPLIQMNPKQASIFIPMELVKLSDKPQKLHQKLDRELTAKFIKKCRKYPAVLFNEININLNAVKRDAKDVLRVFETNIGNQIEVVAKVLPNIGVKYPANAMKREFYDKHLKNFSYGVVIVDRSVYCDKYDEYINKVKHIIKTVTKYGCDFSRNFDPIYEIHYDSRSNLFDILQPRLECINKNERKNHLAFFIVKNGTTSYGMIKMYCEHKEFLGCHSQVLRTTTFDKINIEDTPCKITMNIAIKLNGKLGGLSKNLYYRESDPILTKFCKKFFNENDATIYIGVHVIHPGPHDTSDNGLPSISAVVGSVDIKAFKYAVSGGIHTTIVQKEKQTFQILQFFKDQIKERLNSFINSTGVVPRHIVVFRAGISNSQFKITMDYEVSSIYAACKEINEKYKPTITFLTIQKHHGVRFMNPHDGPNYNVPQNTVVANDIVNPEILDFYIVTHKEAHGTSKPCHAYILYDDWNLSLNEISLLTCWMSNVCTRCSGPISTPTPCYYAYLACNRLKQHYIWRKEYLRKTNGNSGVTIDIHPLMEGEQFFV
uniref:Protein argonaute-2 (inferred by orthology to a D. melanogaster protein) n=1 Tax=Strongyloides venezuelensis TaxID=75913 RepID=A0A0K0FFY3_STRVS